MDIIDLSHQDFDKKLFIEKYWQQQPVLFKSFFRNFEDPLSPSELAGFGCEAGIESRIISANKVNNTVKASPWQLQNGPFTESHFKTIAESHWCLLLQSLDHWVPSIHALLAPFRFLPGHLLDDVMVNYSPLGGSVGPHFDYYDVFLLQGMGSKEWRIGQSCDESSERLINCDLSILSTFKEAACTTLTRGDALYLPANIAHWGIATCESITYSIGFRNPSLSQCISHLADETLAQLMEHQRVQFPVDENTQHSEISSRTLNVLKQQIADSLLNDENILQWYGKFSSQQKNDNGLDHTLEDHAFEGHEEEEGEGKIEWSQMLLVSALQQTSFTVFKNEGARFFHATQAQYFYLFIDGSSFKFESAHINTEDLSHLCKMQIFHVDILTRISSNTASAFLIPHLLNKGSLYTEEDSLDTSL